MSSGAFGELRSLLHQTPSAPRWLQLCADLHAWPEPESLESAIHYAQDHLRQWPNELRTVPKFGISALATGKRLPQAPLWRVLDAQRRHIGDKIIEQLQAQTLQLISLRLSAELTSVDIARLGQWHGLDQLERLELEQCTLNDDALSPLFTQGAEPPTRPARLERLSLSHNRLGPTSMSALIASGWASGLKALSMEGNLPTSAAGMLWANFQPGPELQTFSIGGQPTPTGDAIYGLEASGLTELFHAPWLSQLRQLSLNGNAIAQAGAQVLAAALQAQKLTHLEQLSLNSNHLGPSELRWIVDAMPKLKALSVGLNWIGDEGAASFQVEQLNELERLALFSTQLGDQGLGFLLSSPHLSKLRILDLSFNQLDDVAMRRWQDHRLEQLEDLDLGVNRLQDDGLYAITRAQGLEQLKHLRLHNNAIGAKSCRVLATSQHLEQLETLDLSSNPIEDAGVQALAEGHWPSLRVLDLCRCQITLQGILELTQSPAFPALEQLELEGNRIPQAGYKALATSGALPPLITRHYATKLVEY